MSVAYSGHDMPPEREIPRAIDKAPAQIANLFLNPSSVSSISRLFIPSSSMLVLTKKAYMTSEMVSADGMNDDTSCSRDWASEAFSVEMNGRISVAQRAKVKIRKRSATIGSSFHPKLAKGLLSMPAPDGCEISLGTTLSWNRSQTLSSISNARPTETWKNEPKVTTQVPSLLM